MDLLQFWQEIVDALQTASIEVADDNRLFALAKDFSLAGDLLV